MLKREIKKIKKDIKIQGVREVGYYISVIEKFSSFDVLTAVKELVEDGIDVSRCDDCVIQDLVVEKLINNMCYQEFKNIVDYFFYTRTANSEI